MAKKKDKKKDKKKKKKKGKNDPVEEVDDNPLGIPKDGEESHGTDGLLDVDAMSSGWDSGTDPRIARALKAVARGDAATLRFLLAPPPVFPDAIVQDMIFHAIQSGSMEVLSLVLAQHTERPAADRVRLLTADIDRPRGYRTVRIRSNTTLMEAAIIHTPSAEAQTAAVEALRAFVDEADRDALWPNRFVGALWEAADEAAFLAAVGLPSLEEAVCLANAGNAEITPLGVFAAALGWASVVEAGFPSPRGLVRGTPCISIDGLGAAIRHDRDEVLRVMLRLRPPRRVLSVAMRESDSPAVWKLLGEARVPIFDWNDTGRMVLRAVPFAANLKRVLDHPLAAVLLGDNFAERMHDDLTRELVALSAGISDVSASLRVLVRHGYDVNRLTKASRDHLCTPLLLACSAGCPSLPEAMIGAGADLNTANVWGRAPIHVAAAKGRADVFEALVDAGADLSLRTASGKSVLHYACRGGNVAIVRRLVEDLGFGSAVNRGTPVAGVNPVMYAAASGRLGVLRFLVEEAGADPSAVAANGRPLVWFATAGVDACLPYVIETLGADPESRLDDGRGLLSACAGRGLVSQTRYLRARLGAGEIAASDADGALNAAALVGDLDLVEAALAAGAAPNDPLAVFNAVTGGHPAAVRRLLEAGGERLVRKIADTFRDGTELVFGNDPDMIAAFLDAGLVSAIQWDRCFDTMLRCATADTVAAYLTFGLAPPNDDVVWRYYLQEANDVDLLEVFASSGWEIPTDGSQLADYVPDGWLWSGLEASLCRADRKTAEWFHRAGQADICTRGWVKILEVIPHEMFDWMLEVGLARFPAPTATDRPTGTATIEDDGDGWAAVDAALASLRRKGVLVECNFDHNVQADMDALLMEAGAAIPRAEAVRVTRQLRDDHLCEYEARFFGGSGGPPPWSTSISSTGSSGSSHGSDSGADSSDCSDGGLAANAAAAPADGEIDGGGETEADKAGSSPESDAFRATIIVTALVRLVGLDCEDTDRYLDQYTPALKALPSAAYATAAVTLGRLVDGLGRIPTTELVPFDDLLLRFVALDTTAVAAPGVIAAILAGRLSMVERLLAMPGVWEVEKDFGPVLCFKAAVVNLPAAIPLLLLPAVADAFRATPEAVAGTLSLAAEVNFAVFSAVIEGLLPLVGVDQEALPWTEIFDAAVRSLDVETVHFVAAASDMTDYVEREFGINPVHVYWLSGRAFQSNLPAGPVAAFLRETFGYFAQSHHWLSLHHAVAINDLEAVAGFLADERHPRKSLKKGVIELSGFMEDGTDVAILPMLLAAGAWGRRPKDVSREIRYHFEHGYFVEGVQLQTMILGREAHTGSRLDLSMVTKGVSVYRDGWDAFSMAFARGMSVVPSLAAAMAAQDDWIVRKALEWRPPLNEPRSNKCILASSKTKDYVGLLLLHGARLFDAQNCDLDEIGSHKRANALRLAADVQWGLLGADWDEESEDEDAEPRSPLIQAVHDSDLALAVGHLGRHSDPNRLLNTHHHNLTPAWYSLAAPNQRLAVALWTTVVTAGYDLELAAELCACYATGCPEIDPVPTMAERTRAAIQAIARGVAPLLAALRPAFGDGGATTCPLPPELLVSVVAAAAAVALVDGFSADLAPLELACLDMSGRGPAVGGGDNSRVEGSFFWRVAERCVDDFAAAARGERPDLIARKADPATAAAVNSSYWLPPADPDLLVSPALRAYATTRWWEGDAL